MKNKWRSWKILDEYAPATASAGYAINYNYRGLCHSFCTPPPASSIHPPLPAAARGPRYNCTTVCSDTHKWCKKILTRRNVSIAEGIGNLQYLLIRSCRCSNCDWIGMQVHCCCNNDAFQFLRDLGWSLDPMAVEIPEINQRSFPIPVSPRSCIWFNRIFLFVNSTAT